VINAITLTFSPVLLKYKVTSSLLKKLWKAVTMKIVLGGAQLCKSHSVSLLRIC
jgi:hypothetical protein